MQVKVVIGTAAFMLTMIILGYAALREPSRLEDMAGAYQGRSVETGGIIFDNNCATCHGVEGKAEACFDSAGNSIPCQGLPLNNYFLLCGDQPQRLADLGWEGTVENYVGKTVSAGRGAIMPAWSNRYGGPMRDDQVQNVTLFVLNWSAGDLCETEPVLFPWPESGTDASVEYQELDLPDYDPPYATQEGDPELGAAAYQNYGCNGCHGLPEEAGSATVGPWLGDIATNGSERIDGYSAQDYIYDSILNPNAFISPDCPTGPCTEPSLMPGDFANRMGNNPQEMADILSYLMGDAYQYP